MLSKRFSLALTVALPVILTSILTSSLAEAATETVLHSFNGIDGTAPILGLTLSSGNLYGVATEGGIYNCGTVFELSPASGGTWNETTLYSFACGKDGSTPLGSVVLDEVGNVYGTTKFGGTKGVGTVFKLAPSGSAWTKTTLHNFGSTADGQYPTGASSSIPPEISTASHKVEAPMAAVRSTMAARFSRKSEQGSIREVTGNEQGFSGEEQGI